MNRINTRPFETQNYLNSEQDIEVYLQVVLEDGGPALLAAALGDIARARGMTQLARDTGLTRETLYKSLSGERAPITLGQQLVQRLAGFLGHRVPDSHVDGADGDRTLAVATGLFIGHHRVPDLVRAQIAAAVIEQAGGRCPSDARRETLPDQAALGRSGHLS